MIKYMEVYMKNNIVLDVACSDGVTAVVVSHKGSPVEKAVFKTKDDQQYIALLRGYEKGVLLLKSYIESNSDIDSDVFIVTNNKALFSWFKRGFAVNYTDLFNSVIRTVQQIPAKVSYDWSSDLYAKHFAKKSLIDQPKLTGIDDWD